MFNKLIDQNKDDCLVLYYLNFKKKMGLLEYLILVLTHDIVSLFIIVYKPILKNPPISGLVSEDT